MHDWKRLHGSFERLLAAYRKLHSNEEIGIQLLRHAMNPGRYDRTAVEREAASFRMRPDLDRDWEELEALRDAFDALANLGFSASTPAQSVYQTAIQAHWLRLEGEINGDSRWFFRGQRNHRWDSTPTLLRDLRGRADGEALLQGRLQEVRAIVARLLAGGLVNDEFDALAVAQHYSAELGVSTWLLDVTRSPWVALFFASDGGVDGDIGTLEAVELDDWMLFSNRGASALGSIRLTTIDSVPRIRNQNAFFLQAPHPDLFGDLSNRKLYFRQAPGVVFERDSSDTAVRRELIYPNDDPVLAALRSLPPNEGEARRLEWEPTASAFRVLTFDAFLPIARSLLQAGASDEGALSLDSEDELRELCRLHAAVRARRSELGKEGRYMSTLHHLARLVDYRLKLPEQPVEDLLTFNYLQCLDDDLSARRAFRACLAEVSPFWGKVLERAGAALEL